MAVSAIGGGGTAAGRVSNDALRDLGMDDFLKLMISELQNQDPLSPMDNSQLLQQISQMREIASTSSLTDTLQAVLLGQSINNASSLIGKQVRVLNASGDYITGNVEKVSVAQGNVQLYVAGQPVALGNVSEILSA